MKGDQKDEPEEENNSEVKELLIEQINWLLKA